MAKQLQLTLFVKVVKERKVYDNPKSRYEQYVEGYCQKHSSVGKSKQEIVLEAQVC